MFKGLYDFMGGNCPGKFSDHKLCNSRDITDLIFHVTLYHHVIKEPCDLMEGNSSLYKPTLPSLVAIGIVVVDI